MSAADFFVEIAGATCLLSLLASWLLARRVAPARDYASPRGRAAAGVLRAYKLALAPWAREEARSHLPPELADKFYLRSFLTVHFHVAVFTALALLLFSPLWRRLAEPFVLVLATLMVFGLINGGVLTWLRIFDARLRAISVPDDYISMVLSLAVIALAIAALFDVSVIPVFQVAGGCLLLYAPLGKIKHMLFILPGLAWSGRHFGSRGVRPGTGGGVLR